jgi:hypothetical protein
MPLGFQGFQQSFQMLPAENFFRFLIFARPW